jgi:excisionase family DNA binding protein
MFENEYPANELDVIATEVANILSRRMAAKQILKLLQIVFLEVEEAAELLRVKPKTVSTWISQGKIPVRYAGGRPIFLLSELISWTLPQPDTHPAHRLSVATTGKITLNRLAMNRERKDLDAGL